RVVDVAQGLGAPPGHTAGQQQQVDGVADQGEPEHDAHHAPLDDEVDATADEDADREREDHRVASSCSGLSGSPSGTGSAPRPAPRVLNAVITRPSTPANTPRSNSSALVRCWPRRYPWAGSRKCPSA